MRVRFTERGLEEYNEDKQQWEPVIFKLPQKGNAIVSKNEDNTMKYNTADDHFWKGRRNQVERDLENIITLIDGAINE